MADVLIVSEGLDKGTSINTGSDKQTYYKLSLYGADEDAPRRMAESYYAGGSMHGDVALVEAALKRGEGTLGKGGAFLVTTGKFTGRSPKDKHVVKTASVADTIWWENNAAMSEAGFDALYTDMLKHMEGRDYFVQDLVGGADPKHAINVRMVTELAWHGLFIRHMLRRPDREGEDHGQRPAPAVPLGVARAHGLQHGPHPVVEVDAERGVGDEVEDGHRPA